MAGGSQPITHSEISLGLEIPELTSDNYKVWRERVLLHLGCMDIDYAIRKDEPPAVNAQSTPAEIALYERWERSNRLSVMFIKTKISPGIRGSVDQHKNVNDLLKAIDDQFVTSEKALASTLILKFSSLRLTTVKGVRKHIKNKFDKSRTTTSKSKGKGKMLPKADIKKVQKCYFCKKKGHMKKDCAKFKKWLENKGYAESKEASGK
ncbi:unnamed protein product [Cuscuta europaea]|uniref:CCHC-type domain-containing protein n=1 Tax=Cuscuta europaea TaxID=41803 RepID=A0A9P1ED37_CUSEU|nr:unnamed protein product [Cuscuta europaea]